MNLLMNTQAYFERGGGRVEGEAVGGGWREWKERPSQFIWYSYSECLHCIVSSFMAQLCLLGCGPPEKKKQVLYSNTLT